MAAPAPSRSTGSHLRRAVLILAALAVAALVLPPFINVSRYKGRVIQAVGKAIGRPVTCDAVELRLLPQPGFSLSNVSIADDASYSLEPILHADELTAYIGASSLWRGRMEIARVNLDYASLNLVEREDGSWNFEPLLWKTSRTQTAPTSASPSGTRLRFPYIEVSNGRINFKHGLEKSQFSLTDASFKLWSPAEDQWRMRVEAQPVRTDMPVTDTGRVKAEATIQRATMLRDSPVQASIDWQRVQLGNLTRLLSGEDGGWRGTLDASAQVSGTASALHFATAARLRDLRRFDIASEDEANLNLTCKGQWNAGAKLLQEATCTLPLDGGLLELSGNVSGFAGRQYDITVAAEKIGADALLDLARHTKRNLSEDLRGSGSLSGELRFTRTAGAAPSCSGKLQLQNLVLRSSTLGNKLDIGNATLSAGMTQPEPGRHKRQARSAPAPNALSLESFDLPLGGAAPLTVNGTLDTERFALRLKGDATLERLQQFARTFGLAAPKLSLIGATSIDLTIAGNWAALQAPQLSGSAQLKNARADVPGIALPVQIANARVDFDGDRLSLHNASATAGKISLTGSASFPLSCTADAPCEASFDLTSDEFNPERWNELLNPHLRKTPWYLFTGEHRGSIFPNLHAAGRLAARRLTLDSITGSAFESDLSYANAVLIFKHARAQMLGGTVSGDGSVNFTSGEPKIESTGAAEHIQAEKLSPLLKAPLGTGALRLSYVLQASGWDRASLAHSATAQSSFTWTGGAMRISPGMHGPLHVISGNGKAVLDSKGWTISDSEWKTRSGTYQLSGTVSRDFALDIEFTQHDAVWRVGGTLANPQPESAATTQATQR
jgi:uncharacterized protein involved in outer membrane biogenesis